MRIVAGAWRGCRLQAPSGRATRPTSDRARQTLFDILAHAPWGGPALLQGACVLDGFAGSGALGLEALSRGAARAIFIEHDRAALTCLRANIAALQAGPRGAILAADLGRVKSCTGPACRLVLLDPPYGAGLLAGAVAALAGGGWMEPGAIVAMELAAADADPVLPDAIGILDRRRVGAARLLIARYK